MWDVVYLSQFRDAKLSEKSRRLQWHTPFSPSEIPTPANPISEGVSNYVRTIQWFELDSPISLNPEEDERRRSADRAKNNALYEAGITRNSALYEADRAKNNALYEAGIARDSALYEADRSKNNALYEAGRPNWVWEVKQIQDWFQIRNHEIHAQYNKIVADINSTYNKIVADIHAQYNQVSKKADREYRILLGLSIDEEDEKQGSRVFASIKRLGEKIKSLF